MKSVDIEADYVPIDFEAYSIVDKDINLAQIDKKKNLDKADKIWRISSLTASIDDDTKILILPLPESKRSVKIVDTKYQLETYEDLIQTQEQATKKLALEKEIVKRFADKTPEELAQDAEKKKRNRINKLTRVRIIQMGCFCGGIFGYFFVYRRFFLPKPVMGSHTFVQACDYLKSNG